MAYPLPEAQVPSIGQGHTRHRLPQVQDQMPSLAEEPVIYDDGDVWGLRPTQLKALLDVQARAPMVEAGCPHAHACLWVF